MSETGKPISRIDGRMKVSGKATYAAEFNQPNMAYAFPVRASIAKGKIASINDDIIRKEAGVIAVISYKNAYKLKPLDMQAQMKAGAGFLGENLPPLQDNTVHYPGQFVAVIVAETYEQARAAAYKLQVKYIADKAAVDLKTELPKSTKPKMFMGEEAQVNEGKAAGPLAASAKKVDHTYSTPVEHHHPMEPHATVAVWEGTDKLTLYDATQGVGLTSAIAAYFFGLKQENVRVMAPFVGGGFGSKGLWLHTLLVAMAAKAANRPVKLALTRQMMQTNVGHRAATIQRVGVGTDAGGQLNVLRHHTNTYNNLTQFFEPSGKQTLVLYKARLREVTYNVAHLDRSTPTFMRAPGETPGTFALECAMDEMAYQLKMDPVEFRIKNHTTKDPVKGHDFSSEFLVDCYRTGAKRFGWASRSIEPRQKRQGKYLVGYGMATATYPGGRSAASVKVLMNNKGDVTVMTASIDIGTGTYTVLAQTAADALGIPVEKIDVKIGDSSLPPAPLAGGSQTTASIHPAALDACVLLRKELISMAIADPGSKLNGSKPDDIDFANGKLFVKGNKDKSDTYLDILNRAKRNEIEACATTLPVSGAGLTVPSALCTPSQTPAEQNSDIKQYAFHSFGAQFAEVWVDEDLGTIRVKRVTSVQDVGRIMNEKTARSQIIGGVIFGIGAALMEATEYDKRWGNPVTRTLADYHVPVHLDVPPIDVHFIGKPDPHISPIGARGIGEIGITGVSAAIANAVFNATGKRLRDLPLTPEKFFES
ncbi:xanthine dehydrogenase family protein molybdopterin-binding subunit [Mucilaginibacter achroorhodeus]|uniref:Xanthine dehydrogenase family protein molybdopterin-binding subunit n=1 Tax=Mucilaginibacter achroorhodeus TaxID=2599294 RepID=A0A563TXS7_9SPHI|nr:MULTISPECIES: xanthine dehydrogenase family protein molybdopterin-binding subunit [Mucilaginibacter]QXV65963.1 xanthine dehydrogenase family protein molybdopterin-binding subunit [Mucilaginibacter sp. 21P]TWR24177.1 xanthine dehydrogenase family protein molybdopterin-binding subunit [Mucilaginibacter achroorhodeus]